MTAAEASWGERKSLGKEGRDLLVVLYPEASMGNGHLFLHPGNVFSYSGPHSALTGESLLCISNDDQSHILEIP